MATTHRPRHHQATNTGGIARCSIRPFYPSADPPRTAVSRFSSRPGAAPYRAKLEDLVSHLPDGLDKKMVFHICGDTGGVKNPGRNNLSPRRWKPTP